MDSIIIITHNFLPESVGGASRMYEMARLLQRFYKVTVLCPPPTYPFTKYEKSKYIFQKEILDGIKVFRIWTFQPSKTHSFFQRFLYYTIFPIFASIILITQLKKASFVIVTTPPSSLLLSTLIVRLFNKKLILDVRDLWVEAAVSLGYVNKNNMLTKIVKKFETYCWKKSDLVITNSMVILEIIKQKLGKQNSSKVKYFPFNVDLDAFKKYNVKRKKQITYIGNFGVAQNLTVLIKAMQIVLLKIPDLKIQLYGGGDQELEIKELVKELKLEEYFEFHSPIPRVEIPEILSKSILGIVPLADNNALRYAIPTKTFEYFSCSLPVLAYGHSEELERVIKDSNAGMYVEGNNYKEIADAIIRILSDQSLLEQFSINGRKFVEQTKDFSFFLLVS